MEFVVDSRGWSHYNSFGPGLLPYIDRNGWVNVEGHVQNLPAEYTTMPYGNVGLSELGGRVSYIQELVRKTTSQRYHWEGFKIALSREPEDLEVLHSTRL